MPLNTSGPISLGGSASGQSVNLELRQSSIQTISFNDPSVRRLIEKPSGTVSMPADFWGKDVYKYTSGSVVIDNTFSPDLNEFFGIGYGASSMAGYGKFISGGPLVFQELGTWVQPATSEVGNTFEFKATITYSNGIGVFNGPVDSWVNGAQYWSLSVPAGFTGVRNFRIDFRRYLTTTVLTSISVSITRQEI